MVPHQHFSARRGPAGTERRGSEGQSGRWKAPGVGGATRPWTLAALTLAAVAALDQATKAVLVASIAPGERIQLFPGLALTNVRNTGIAFGVLAGGGAALALVTAVALLLLLAYFARHARTTFLWLPVGLLLGGALGNIVDRATQGGVIDFIDPVAWPAFNLADASIVLGVIAVLWVGEVRPRTATR